MGTLFRVLNSTLAQDRASSPLHRPPISQSLGVGQRERGADSILPASPSSTLKGPSEGAGNILPDGPPSSTLHLEEELRPRGSWQGW